MSIAGDLYKDILTIVRVSEEGSVNTTTGKFTPDSTETTVYSGDAQEIPVSGEEYRGNDFKTIQTMIDFFLKDESLIADFSIGEKGTLLRNGRTHNVSVIGIREIDSDLTLVIN